jgi:hypothetical protein
MKNIVDICKDFGLEVPADKHADFLKAVNGEYKTIAEHNKVLDKLSTATKRAETAEETLKGFEGKDFDTIIRERDEWKCKHDENEEKYRREQEDREYNEDLEHAAKDAKCRDLKGASAHLDHENLRKSRNRKADMKTAFDALRTDKGYFFEDNGGNPQFTATGSTQNNGGKTVKDIMSIKDPAERQAQIVQNMHLFTKG